MSTTEALSNLGSVEYGSDHNESSQTGDVPSTMEQASGEKKLHVPEVKVKENCKAKK